jgi:hypothetical protein
MKPEWASACDTSSCVEVSWVSACGDSFTCVEVGTWHTASAGNGACVQVGPCRCGDGQVLIRDSKDPDGPRLAFTAEEWTVFRAGVKAGKFDHI